MTNSDVCSYTITSRRYSIWTLVQRYLDAPFNRFMHRHGGLAHEGMLDRFRLSEIHKVDPPPIAANHCLPIREPEFQRRYALKQYRISEWQKCFKTLVRQSQASTNKANAKRVDEFEKTLDFVQADLLSVIQGLIPGRQRPNHTDELGNWNQHTRRAQTYCELCWRPTEYTLHQESFPGDTSGDYKNKRFCHEHDPGNPRSKYRVDHRYKRAFRNELMHLQQLTASEYAVPFTLPAVTTLAAMRKAAYDLVHAGLHSPDENRARRHSLKEKVYAMKEQGLSQADIARELGVSRQAVSKAWKQVNELLARRAVAVAMDERHEDFQPQVSVARFLAEMAKQGRSITCIIPGQDSSIQ